MANCGNCNRAICKYAEYICCVKSCHRFFHLECENLNLNQYNDLISKGLIKSWVCSDCTRNQHEKMKNYYQEPTALQELLQRKELELADANNTIKSLQTELLKFQKNEEELQKVYNHKLTALKESLQKKEQELVNFHRKIKIFQAELTKSQKNEEELQKELEAKGTRYKKIIESYKMNLMKKDNDFEKVADIIKRMTDALTTLDEEKKEMSIRIQCLSTFNKGIDNQLNLEHKVAKLEEQVATITRLMPQTSTPNTSLNKAKRRKIN